MLGPFRIAFSPLVEGLVTEDTDSRPRSTLLQLRDCPWISLTGKRRFWRRRDVSRVSRQGISTKRARAVRRENLTLFPCWWNVFLIFPSLGYFSPSHSVSFRLQVIWLSWPFQQLCISYLWIASLWVFLVVKLQNSRHKKERLAVAKGTDSFVGGHREDGNDVPSACFCHCILPFSAFLFSQASL